MKAIADVYGVKILLITSFKDIPSIVVLPKSQKQPDKVIHLNYLAGIHFNFIRLLFIYFLHLAVPHYLFIFSSFFLLCFLLAGSSSSSSDTLLQKKKNKNKDKDMENAKVKAKEDKKSQRKRTSRRRIWSQLLLDQTYWYQIKHVSKLVLLLFVHHVD